MRPIELFWSLVAVAGGVLAIGLAAVAVVVVWAAVRGWAKR